MEIQGEDGVETLCSMKVQNPHTGEWRPLTDLDIVLPYLGVLSFSLYFVFDLSVCSCVFHRCLLASHLAMQERGAERMFVYRHQRLLYRPGAPTIEPVTYVARSCVLPSPLFALISLLRSL